MAYDDFQMYMLGFVRDVIQQLDVDTGRTRVAVASYSDTAQVRRTLPMYNTKNRPHIHIIDPAKGASLAINAFPWRTGF